MARTDKLKNEFLQATNTFSWNRFATLVARLGYEEMKRGKSSGSKRKLINRTTGHKIRADEPHDGVMRRGMIKRLKENLEENGVL